MIEHLAAIALEAGAEESKDWKGRVSYIFHETDLSEFAQLIEAEKQAEIDFLVAELLRVNAYIEESPDLFEALGPIKLFESKK